MGGTLPPPRVVDVKSPIKAGEARAQGRHGDSEGIAEGVLPAEGQAGSSAGEGERRALGRGGGRDGGEGERGACVLERADCGGGDILRSGRGDSGALPFRPRGSG